MTRPPHRLAAHGVSLGYGTRVVSENLSVAVPDGSFTVIVGPNASGKSTLLRALARVGRPLKGQVTLDGQAIAGLPTRQVARRLGLLPQSAAAPDGITVAELVSRGRFPHRGTFGGWSAADEAAVQAALAATGTAELAARPMDELSGGQRQRAWVALVLAQETPLLLLDEPTSFLDIAHQIELLNLLRRLNRDHGRTVVAVLHDLNHACRYADHLVAMRDGRVVAEGPPSGIVTAAFVADTFGLPCCIIDDPVTGTPLVVPLAD